MAVLVVLLFHLTGKLEGWAYPLQLPFRMGWSGVDLFFVLSGFLIGGILLDAKQSPRYFRTFYLRRVYRIMPIYYLWISLFAAVVLTRRWMPANFELSVSNLRFYPAYLAFLQNYTNVQVSQFGFAWLTPLWSLAVEEQFYLVAPAIIRWLNRKVVTTLLLVSLVICPLLRVAMFTMGHVNAMVAWMPSRADSLGMGVLMAIAWRNPKARDMIGRCRRYIVMGLVALGGVVAILAEHFPERTSLLMASCGFTVLGVFCAGLIAAILTKPSGGLASLMRTPLLRHLGGVSYAMYIVHVLVYSVLCVALSRLFPAFHGLGSLAVSLLAAVLVWGIARLSWEYFEGPLMRKGHSYRY